MRAFAKRKPAAARDGDAGSSVLRPRRGFAAERPVVIQRVNVGFVPTTPGNYRTTTTLTGSTNATAGDKPFHNLQRPLIYANNVQQGGNTAPVLGVGNYPQDDFNNGALLDRNITTPIEPEVDHIVPRADGGANDYANARVLSKQNNVGNAAGRPNRGAQDFKLYQQATLTASIPRQNQANYTYGPTTINAGSVLNQTQAQLLALHAGRNMPNAIGNLSKDDVNAISNTGPGLGYFNTIRVQ